MRDVTCPRLPSLDPRRAILEKPAHLVSCGGLANCTVSCRQPSPSYCLSPHPTNDAVDAQNGHGFTSCRRLILQPRKTCPSLLPHSTHSLLTKGFAVWLCCAACCWWVFPQRPRLETAAASSVAHTHPNYRPVTLLVVTVLSQPPSIVDSIPPIPPTTDMPFRG